MTSPAPDPRRGHELAESGLQMATRLVALLRTGRAYDLANPVFTGQLEQLLGVLLPVLRETGDAQLAEFEGDLHLNGVRLPLRPSSLKFTEQLVQELRVREIAGVQFLPGLGLAELERFMRFFLPSEIYKGADLADACAGAGLAHTRILLAITNSDAAAPGREAAPEPGEAADAPGWSVALAAFDRALANARTLLEHRGVEAGMELRHVKRVVQPLVDAAIGEDVPAALAEVTRGPAPPWRHATDTCLVAVAIGRQLGLGRHALAEIGACALLHDVGHDAVAATLPAEPESWSDADAARVPRHVPEGLRRIAASTTLNATTVRVMRTILEHHAADPRYPSAESPAPESQIVAIADAFVSLLSLRDPRASAMTPCDALGTVLGPWGAGFHPALRAALVRAVGLYPPGQLVELDDGAIGRSLGAAPGDPARPLLQPLIDASGAPEPLERRHAPEFLAPERRVRRALPLAEWPLDPAA